MKRVPLNPTDILDHVVHTYLKKLENLPEADQQKITQTLLHEYEKITGLKPRKISPGKGPKIQTPEKGPKTPTPGRRTPSKGEYPGGKYPKGIRDKGKHSDNYPDFVDDYSDPPHTKEKRGRESGRGRGKRGRGGFTYGYAK